MKCTNCGCEIPKGKLYCPECGTEVQLVPDFTTVSMERQQLLKEQAELERRMRRRAEAEARRNRVRPAVAMARLFMILLISAGLTFLMVFYIRQHAWSNFGDQNKHAREEFEGGNYAMALTYCDRALALRPDSAECGVFKAKILLQMDNPSGAESVLREVVRKNPASLEACEELLQLLLEREDYDGVSEVVRATDFQSIKAAYSKYLSDPPTFSLVSGNTYPAGTKLKMYCKEGTIYYTTDGTTPSEQSGIYRSPVVLEKGIARINAVCMNQFGVKSKVVKAIYTIE